MEWQQIVGFQQVAKLGSFTKAGEVTFRTQSALSQQIKALEEELDCRLLERIGKRRLRLTAAGEIFFQFSAAVLERLARLQEELQELKGLHKGTLRLAAPFTTLYHLFRQVLRQYVERFPQVRLTILDRSQPQVMELVKSGEIDCGLALESAVPKGLTAARWQPVEMFLMAPQGHPLTQIERVSLEQIAAYPLILPPQTTKTRGRISIEAHLREAGLAYHVIMESSNVELSSLYVELGLGISFATMVQGFTLPGRRNLAFVPLSHFVEPDYLAVVMRRDKILPAYKQAFLDLLFNTR